MRIGFDGKRAIQNFTGLGNYSRFVLNLLSQYYSEHSYHLFTPKPPKDNFGIPGNIQLVHPGKYQIKALWRSVSIVKGLKKRGIDLYHGLSNELPLGLSETRIKSIVTIHDLIFLRFPAFYPLIDRTIYKWKCRYACNNATRIIAVSQQTKSDIISFFKIPEDKIDVVYQGCNPAFQIKATAEEKETVCKEYNLPEKFLLNVGTIEERKNLLLIVKALKTVPKDIKLVVIGRETDYAAEVKNYIETHNLSRRVLFLRNVPSKDLPVIYQSAEIFVYPSEFEGFGIPVVEALHSGVPVIAATGSCLEEAGGPGSCYVHPQDEVQLSWCINSILNDQDKRDNMVKAGLEYVKNFSDAKLAADLINSYQKAISNA